MGSLGWEKLALVELVEGVDHARVELSSALAEDFVQSGLEGPGQLVGPLVREGVQGVRDRDDARSERDFLLRRPCG